MNNYCALNLLDVDSLISNFLTSNEAGITTIHKVYFKDECILSLRALIEDLKEELKAGCVSFINKEYPLEEINSYLFYIVNDLCKKRINEHAPKKKTEYLCPGCLFSSKETFVQLTNNYFKCHSCEEDLKNNSDPKRIALYRTFFKHNKLGYRCKDCNRFLPHPLDDSPVISCPYYDCIFVGGWSSLKRMHHPSLQSNAEILTLDTTLSNGLNRKNLIIDSDLDPQGQLIEKENIENQFKVLSDIIEAQKNAVPYSSSEFTVKHKFLVYEAFNNILNQYPNDMISYLLEKSRSGGFQHKIFQEYIMLLEASMPFSFKKNNEIISIESLLDPGLNLFDGISVFESIVSEKLEIKNETKEFYIGGRKGAIAKPYYIGKLLSVFEKKSKTPLLNKVTEYSFSKIKMKDIVPGTEISVTHLRVPPHYQMGGMVYINRARKKIVDRALVLLNKENNGN